MSQLSLLFLQAFDEGWGGVICKTLSLDSKKVVNVSPRYAKLRDSAGKVFGWQVGSTARTHTHSTHAHTQRPLNSPSLRISQNFELISDRPFETMLAELKRLKQEYPNRILIASIMEEYNKAAWEEIIGRCGGGRAREGGEDAGYLYVCLVDPQKQQDLATCLKLEFACAGVRRSVWTLSRSISVARMACPSARCVCGEGGGKGRGAREQVQDDRLKPLLSSPLLSSLPSTPSPSTCLSYLSPQMGMAMGQDCELLSEVCGWINGASKIPVWAKMTPNITDITKPAECALLAGCEGVAAINTIQVCVGVWWCVGVDV